MDNSFCYGWPESIILWFFYKDASVWVEIKKWFPTRRSTWEIGRFTKERNLKRTMPSGSSIIYSISFICLDLSWEVDWASSSSTTSGIIISSHLRSFKVKTWGLTSSICSKIVSFEFQDKVLKNFILGFVDINRK